MRAVFLCWISIALGLPMAAASEPVDIVLVPGCPNEPDGTLSQCQWERVVWAVSLYESGHAASFITSGNAVHTRHVEAHALKAGMVALGVPPALIDTETQALHSDENASYSLTMAQRAGARSFGVATHALQATVLKKMLRNWGIDPVVFPMDRRLVADRLAEGVPRVQTDAVAEDDWFTLEEREQQRWQTQGYKRPSSGWLYFWRALTWSVAKYQRPMAPPVALAADTPVNAAVSPASATRRN